MANSYCTLCTEQMIFERVRQNPAYCGSQSHAILLRDSLQTTRQAVSNFGNKSSWIVTSNARLYISGKFGQGQANLTCFHISKAVFDQSASVNFRWMLLLVGSSEPTTESSNKSPWHSAHEHRPRD